MTRRLLALASFALPLLVSCDRPTTPSVPAPGMAAAPPPSLPPPPPEPAVAEAPLAPAVHALLQAPDPFISLPVEGYEPAVVSLPLGARGKRPVVLATHGNYDRPEWQCAVWRGIVGDRAFVLCPRGFARPDSPSRDDVRFSYQTNEALDREVTAALAALAARFPDHADVDRPLYTGFSLGAIMGVSIAARAPLRYPRLVLIEGGHDRWTHASAAAFVKGGGQRVLFVCSQAWCESDARLAGSRLRAAGGAVKVVRGRDVGHSYSGPVAEETKRALGWVLEDDDRWSQAPAAPP
jgi:dienelactone hydrolase